MKKLIFILVFLLVSGLILKKVKDQARVNNSWVTSYSFAGWHDPEGTQITYTLDDDNRKALRIEPSGMVYVNIHRLLKYYGLGDTLFTLVYICDETALCDTVRFQAILTQGTLQDLQNRKKYSI